MISGGKCGPAGQGGDQADDFGGHGEAKPSPRVLIIDDDHGIREALRMVLTDEDIGCVLAGNGAEALELLNAGLRPDVIVLDLMMPVMNGWEFRAAQLAAPRLAAIPVIVLSAATDSPARLRALGLDEVLRKPVDLGRLFAALERKLPGWQPD